MMTEYVTLDGIRYPYREIWLDKYGINARIAGESLNSVIMGENGDYASRDAMHTDEMMFFYVPDEMVLIGVDGAINELVSDNVG